MTRPSLYGIRAGYRHRTRPAFFDDTPFKDEWQREVYERAARMAATRPPEAVYDVGCGSAFKLVKNFPAVRTVGFELEPTLSWLRSTYPAREWLASDFSAQPVPADLVICADVIEHIPDPTSLLTFLQRITLRRLVLSTPDRDLLYAVENFGKPENHAHCREWTQPEFRAFVSGWFKVLEQTTTNSKQGTQMLVCAPL